MAKVERLNDFQNGTRADAEQVDAEFDNLVQAHNEMDDELQNKLSIDGDFKGTWNGHEFKEADSFISSRVTAMENMVREEEKVTVTLKRGENTIEAPEHASLVPIEILGDEVKNLALDFDHWTLHANVVKNSQDKVVLNAASAKEVSSLKVEVSRNQDYVYSMKHTGAIAILDSALSDTPVVAYTDAQFIKFNSGNHSTIHLVFKNKNDEPGTFTFEGPMLIEGTVEREFVQNYQPVRGPYIEVDNGSYLNFDEYLYKGDKLYQDGQGNWRKKQNKIECELTAENVKNPTVNSSYTGGKAIKIPLDEVAKGIDIYEVEVIKFNNSYFTRTDSAANITSNRYYLDDESLLLFVSATETGWGDDFTPSKMELLTFLLGWKMYQLGNVNGVYNNTGTKAWVKIKPDGTFTQGQTTQPTGSHEFWIPFKIIYKTTSEQDVPAKYEGALRLTKGVNKVTLGEGVVLREIVTPFQESTNAVINKISNTSSLLKNKTNEILAIFNNGVLDSLWTVGSGSSSYYGGGYAHTPKVTYDPTSTYSVTYKALDRFSFSCYVGNVEAKHTVNFHMESNEQTREIQELKNKVAQHDLIVVDKLGKKNGVALLGSNGFPVTFDGKRAEKIKETIYTNVVALPTLNTIQTKTYTHTHSFRSALEKISAVESMTLRFTQDYQRNHFNYHFTEHPTYGYVYGGGANNGDYLHMFVDRELYAKKLCNIYITNSDIYVNPFYNNVRVKDINESAVTLGNLNTSLGYYKLENLVLNLDECSISFRYIATTTSNYTVNAFYSAILEVEGY